MEMLKEESPSEKIEEAASPSRSKQRLETFHIMTTRDISEDENATSVTNLLTTGIGHAIVDVRVVAQPTDEDNGAGMKFLERLKRLANLMFRGA